MQKSNHYKFMHSMFWNSLDSVMAQGLVTAHHILLQVFAGPEFHGLFASYTSLIYTFIPFFNLGFDYALSAYLKDFTQTKKSFISLLLFQFLPQLLFTMLVVHLISKPFFYNIFFTSTITPEIAFWLKSAFIIEYIRKSLRSFLQLMLHTRTTALVEIIGTFSYMAMFWILAWLFNIQPTLVLSFKLLATFALIQTAILLTRTIKIYSSFDSTDKTNNIFSAHQGISKSRVTIWANHLTSQINYSNFMVPFSNACFGPAQASVLAILMNCARCIKLFFQKGLGTSSLAIISQHSEQNTAKDSKYAYPIHYLYNLSVPLLIFFLVNSSKLSHLFTDNQTVWYLASIACLLSIVEGAISVYEKFYIVEKKVHLYFILNSMGSILLFIAAYYFSVFNSLAHFFLFFFLIRSIALISIITLSHHLFKLSHTPSFNTYILATATLFSFLFFLLF